MKKYDFYSKSIATLSKNANKTLNNLVSLMILWEQEKRKYLPEAERLNGEKSVYDKRTRGGKYLAGKAVEFKNTIC